MFNLSKRQKIIIASVLMTLALVISTHSVNFIFLKYRLILILAVLTYLLSLWALWEGMTKLKAVVLLILPTLYTISVTSFYFLLPVRWLTRVPLSIVFGLSFYCLLLAQNVFNVASFRTIPLYRAASTASFLFTLITSLFLFNVLYAVHLNFYLNGLFVFIISFVLILQHLWTLEMDRINSLILIYSFIMALIVAEVGVVMSFVPVVSAIWALYLCIVIYCLVGIMTEFMKNKVTKRVVVEYFSVGLSVVLLSFILFNFFANFWYELNTLAT